MHEKSDPLTGNHSSTIRVLTVLFDDRLQGPSKGVIQVGRVLREFGVEMILCLPARGGNAPDVARDAGIAVQQITFERIPRPDDPKRILQWIVCIPRDVWRFTTLFRQKQPDVVEISGAFFLPPAIAAKLLKLPLVWRLLDTIVPRRFAPAFGMLVRLMANHIVVAAKAVALHYGVENAPYKVIYPAVDIKLFGSGQRRINDPERKVARVGLVANWSPIKGVEYFVQAAALVREQLNEELEVVFAGARFTTHAEYCQRVEDLMRELGLDSAVRDHGFVLSLAAVLEDLDVLVLSSTSEAAPTVVLEGMAAGVPVVATNVGGVCELLVNEPARPAGILVPPKAPDAMAAAILYLLRHPIEAARMGENGRRLVKERFSLQECVQRHLELYRHVQAQPTAAERKALPPRPIRKGSLTDENHLGRAPFRFSRTFDTAGEFSEAVAYWPARP